MDATMFLYKLGTYLGNTVSELKHHLFLFSASSTASKYEKDQFFYHLKKTIIPFVESCSNKISSAAASLSPIPCSKYVDERKEREKKNDAVLVSKRKNPPLVRIENTLTGELSSAKRMCTAQTWPSLCHGQKLSSSLKSVLPPPTNSIQYTKQEIVGLLAVIQNLSVHLLAINQVKLVSTSRSLIYKLPQQHNRNEPILREWQGVGRKRLLDNNQIKVISDNLRKENSKPIGQMQIKEIMMTVQREQIQEQEFVPISKCAEL
eukprot:14273483-Ditylum_brightwellii.AAC.2